MPDLDLSPDRYRIKAPDGRWIQRDSKPALLLGVIAGIAFIGFILWRTPQPTTVTLLLVAMIGICAGGLLGRLTKDIY